MKVQEKYIARMEALLDEGNQIGKLKLLHEDHSGPVKSTDIIVDRKKFIPWQIKVLALLESLCGLESQYFKHAFESRSKASLYEEYVHIVYALKAAYDDCKGGYLANRMSLVEAEVFSDFLAQAKELHEYGYKDAAAVIAGGVLEKHLRSMCAGRSIDILKPNGKNKMIDDLNTDLRRADVYDLLKWKQIVSWADIRNNAAHGNYDKYSSGDVADLIKKVTEFCADYK